MRILVFRLSAMGDVALTVPVIRGALNNNPGLEITLVTRPFFLSFFDNIERLNVITPDFNDRYRGFLGIIRLFFALKERGSYDCIIDLHNVLRTQILGILFVLTGQKTYKINKTRSTKRKYLKLKEAPALPHTTELYHQVFSQANIIVAPITPPVFTANESCISSVELFISENNLSGHILVGIAPFAKHKLKIWPTEYIQSLIQKLSANKKVRVLLFGGGKKEVELLEQLAFQNKNCLVIKLPLTLELVLIQKLRVMVSMDSANMHIAALSGIPVISIWGATHPGIGFGPWQQPISNAIQIDVNELTCRPCTIYGKGDCRRKDFACMKRIIPNTVLRHINNYLS